MDAIHPEGILGDEGFLCSRNNECSDAEHKAAKTSFVPNSLLESEFGNELNLNSDFLKVCSTANQGYRCGLCLRNLVVKESRQREKNEDRSFLLTYTILLYLVIFCQPRLIGRSDEGC